MSSSIWSELAPGTIVDKDIRRLAENGQLITENFEPSCIKQACYELRASNVCYVTSEPEEKRRKVLDVNGFLLKPHTFVTMVVEETIELPDNVLARVLTKGQLFSIGILPVNTYVDPGFQGRLGITLCNVSHRHLIIKPSQPIAKIEFSVLSSSVEKPYAGQHGYQTHIWPVPVHHYATASDLERRGVSQNSSSEVRDSYGPVVALLNDKVTYYERKVWLQIAITVVAFSLILGQYKEMSWMVAILLGVITNLITQLGTYLLGRRTNWL